MYCFEAELQKFPGPGLGIDVVLCDSSDGIQWCVVERVKEKGSVEAWNRRSKEPYIIRPRDLIVRVNGLEGNVRALADELASGKDLRITIQRPPESAPPRVSLAQALTGSGTPGNPVIKNSAVRQDPHVTEPKRPEKAWSMPLRVEPPNSAFTTISGRPYETMVVNLSLRDGMRLGIDVLPVNLAPSLNCRGLNIQKVTSNGAVAMWNVSQGPGRSIKPEDCIINLNNIVDDIAAMMKELQTRREFKLEILRQGGALAQPHDVRAITIGPKQPPERPWFQRDATEPQSRPQTIPPKSAGCALSHPVGAKMGPPPRRSGMEIPEPSAEPLAEADLCDLPALAGADDGHMSMHSLQSRRPSAKGQQLTFDVEKPVGVRLGIDVMLVTGSSLCGLIVERVTPGGCVAEWNKRSSSRRRVQPGDYIIQVNGIGSWHNVGRMAEELRSESRYARFTVQRGVRKHLAGVSASAASSNGETVAPEVFPGSAKAPPMMPPTTALCRSTGASSSTLQEGSSQPSPTSLPQPRLARSFAQTVGEGMWASATASDVPPVECGVRSASISTGRTLVTEDPRVDRSRSSCGPVAPIGAGRGAPGPTMSLPAGNGCVRAQGGDEEEMQGRGADRVISNSGQEDGAPRGVVAGVPADSRCDSMSNVWQYVTQDACWLPPALILLVLQLDDKELSGLLNKMLVLRPWLVLPIKKGQLLW
eukprot:CAMPEP_0194487638 /NCGR_PEP_ID=MMETSP0253-20130528/7856_1 /TAXON_ID=2966 /ORGANISM="Noctiluca scintillans" /LENGTH=702 /DNA_ID=CAMNT_0039327889 /DNA_START=63 /DNA_END=2168 /DNA_ORIENTATION=-